MQIRLELLKSRWPRDMISCATSYKQFKGLQDQCNQSPCRSYYAAGQTVRLWSTVRYYMACPCLNIDLTILANSVFFSILSHLCGRHERLMFMCTKLFLLVPPFSLLFWTLLVHPFLKIFSSIWAGVSATGRQLKHHKTVQDNFNKRLAHQTIGGNSPLHTWEGEWVQAFGTTISGIVWVDKRNLWLVNCCLWISLTNQN